MTKKRVPSSKNKTFDKYKYYINSVQCPDADAEFFDKTYKEVRGKKSEAITLREDFCGTFLISCEWIKLNPKKKAHGVDLDSEPLNYGKKNHLPKLTKEQQKRLVLHKKNVLNPNVAKADIISASNFSYYIFKERETLKSYFSTSRKQLNKNGLFIIDCFGGSGCMEPNEEETEHDGFSYFWDQDSYDPVTNHALYYIHFKVDGEKKREKVFTYDWRMWSIPELKDILLDAGFKKVHVYWEGTDDDGEGDGVYTRTEVGEACESWVAYLVAEK